MELLQSYTFTIKHRKGLNKKVVDALNRILLTLQEVKLQSVGIEEFKDMYGGDDDFAEAYKVCSNFENHFHSQFYEFNL